MEWFEAQLKWNVCIRLRQSTKNTRFRVDSDTTWTAESKTKTKSWSRCETKGQKSANSEDARKWVEESSRDKSNERWRTDQIKNRKRKSSRANEKHVWSFTDWDREVKMLKPLILKLPFLPKCIEWREMFSLLLRLTITVLDSDWNYY